MHLAPPLEAQILRLYSDGQTEPAAVSLFKALHGPLRLHFQRRLRYREGASALVDDLVQETIIRVHEALMHERRQGDPIVSLARFSYTCAERVQADAWRRSRKEVLPDQGEDIDDQKSPSVEIPLPHLHTHPGERRCKAVSCPASPEQILEREERTAAIEECLEDLPNLRHRACLLDWLMGLPLREVARRHGYQDTNGPTAAKDSAKRLLIACLEGKGFEVRLA